ncbi:MAG: acyltransferase [Candidatus Saccharibacteria bacterium]|nr:acyltransferase [Pseudorhodobacter sp.]
MKYRAEIDGLRAVAVVPVVLFHASPGLLPGGYLGVDIFFVISGFLITGLLIEDIQAGQYSLARFYERRARRILPALLVMVGVTLLFAWALMEPHNFGTTARSAAAAAAFVSNVFFWQTTDYFDIEALGQPLLHTWSLAVEEQFYILFPVLLAFVWQRVRLRWVVAGLIILTLASLALAAWGAVVHPKVNYYFTFSRMWEVFLGCLGAFLVHYRTLRPNGVLAALGVVAILGSMVMFQPATLHPGLLTLIPTVGALLVLVWGDRAGVVGRALGWAPLVAVGKISYSLYLWHYPVFSFAAAQGPVSTSAGNMVGQIGLVFALSVLSWRFVERPFRRRIEGRGPGRALWVAGGAVGVTIALGLGLAAYPNLALRYLTQSPEGRVMLNFPQTYRASKRSLQNPSLCFFRDAISLTEAARCIPSARPNLVIWGDSHAEALAEGFAAIFPATGLLGGPACSPLIGGGGMLSEECADQNRHIVAALQGNPPDILVLHAYWRNKPDEMGLLPQTIAALRRDLPKTRIVVLGGVPNWFPTLPEQILAAEALGRFDAEVTAQLDGVSEADDTLARVLRDQIAAGDVSFLRLTDLVCRGQACRAYAGTTPFAYDYGHMTHEGATLLAQRLVARYPAVWRGVLP